MNNINETGTGRNWEYVLTGKHLNEYPHTLSIAGLTFNYADGHAVLGGDQGHNVIVFGIPLDSHGELTDAQHIADYLAASRSVSDLLARRRRLAGRFMVNRRMPSCWSLRTTSGATSAAAAVLVVMCSPSKCSLFCLQ